jgi:hypothetical protein
MKTVKRIFLIVAVMAFVSAGGVGVVTAGDPDHYKCYLIKPQQKVDFPNPNSPNLLLLDDQFEREQVRRLISRLLCTPVSKDGSPITTDIHLKAYQIIPSKPLDPRPVVGLQSLNPHFPPEEVVVVKPVFLLVPTQKRCLNKIDPTTPTCP